MNPDITVRPSSLEQGIFMSTSLTSKLSSTPAFAETKQRPTVDRVIVLNGPPRSGKDTVVEMLKHSGMFKKTLTEMFKEPLLRVAAVLMGREKLEIEDYEKLKAQEVFPGVTLRQLLIKISEEWVKPTLGEDYFGKAAVDRVLKKARNKQTEQGMIASNPLLDIDGLTVMFSDSGFPAELASVIKGIKARHVYVVRVHREGKDFSGDSRSFLSIEDIPTSVMSTVPVRFIDVNNNHDYRALMTEVLEKVVMKIRSGEHD